MNEYTCCDWHAVIAILDWAVINKTWLIVKLLLLLLLLLLPIYVFHELRYLPTCLPACLSNLFRKRSSMYSLTHTATSPVKCLSTLNLLSHSSSANAKETPQHLGCQHWKRCWPADGELANALKSQHSSPDRKPDFTVQRHFTAGRY